MSKRRPLALASPAQMPKREALAKPEARIGYDGIPQSQGRYEVEYQPDLEQLEKRVEKFNELRIGSGSIVAALEKLWWPIARATWSIDPADESDTRSALSAEIMRANLLRKGSAIYRMRTSWSQFLWECFTAEQFGFSVHEKVERVQKGPLGTFRVYDHLAWIHPSSVWQFRVDRDGFLLGIVQRFQARYWEGERKEGTEKSFAFDDFIPAEKLFVRTRKKEGSNVEGTALLRGMYADAKRNQNLLNWQTIHAQRVAVGIPKVTITGDAPPSVQATAVDMARAMRGGAQDRLFVVEAPGTSVGWVSNETGALDIAPMLRAGEDRLRGVASLEWAGLGQAGAAGSRAVGDVQQRPFWLMVEGIAEGIAEDVQTQLVEPLHERNFAGVDAPACRAADVSPISIEEIARSVEAGLVVFTPRDSNDIRRSLKLRQMSEDEMDEQAAAFKERAKPARPEPPAPTKDDDPAEDAPPPVKGKAKAEKPAPEAPEELSQPVELAQAKRPAREMTALEREHVDFSTLRACFDATESESAQELRAIRDAAIDEMLAKVQIRGTRATLPKPKRAAAEMVAILTRIAEQAREVGRETMRAEIRSQVAALEPKVSLAERAARAIGLADAPPPFDPFAAKPRKRGVKGVPAVVDAISEEVETVIGFNVESILDAVVKGLRREIATALAAEATEAEAIEAARIAVKGRSDQPLEDAGREIASRGVNGGRAEVAEQAFDTLEDGGLLIQYATRSAEMDANTCEECIRLDGTKVDVESEEYFELMPPAKCLGGARCRCVYVYTVERAP